MGKRKKAKPPPKRRKLTVPKQFDCPFCNHEQSVDCKMKKETNMGEILCRVCKAHFEAPINYLSEPIDVYSDWIDACERVNSATATETEPGEGADAEPNPDEEDAYET